MMRHIGRFAFLGLIASLLPMFIGNALAHGSNSGGSHPGLDIPAISHGEMAVISEYRSSISMLASRAADTNESFRRVLNYSEIQYSYCLWGRMPGSVTDEESPFNECAHAYLAATKAVLMAMREMPREAPAAGEIISAIDADMAGRGLAFITCQFSGEAFNTADIIKPSWSKVPLHPASMASLTGLAALFGLAVLALRRVSRPKAQSSE
ncbi:hypothetical protein HJA82_10605 [Rhizobium bangladeshense]|nr:hypothetical protein [Rhizobium bangladeshense]MBX5257262.1 hypothetical protein [Rhizobium sp. NLR16b]MBX5263354.1 hypothetical protein [Rhizobium sp. NLR16a]MBX5311919.1 hypothetical protein [Rhizobium sp. NLR11b]